MSADAVLSNKDLVRQLLSHSSAAVGILGTSKEIRESEVCTDLYERWARVGCPDRALGTREKRCLDAVEGSAFCVGRWRVGNSELSPAALTKRLQTLIMDPPTTTLRILLTLGSTRIVIWLRPNWNELITIVNGWRRKGIPCTPPTQQVKQLLQTIITTVGEVTLPCPKRSRALTSVVVPRDVELSISRVVDGSEELLLSATRS